MIEAVLLHVNTVSVCFFHHLAYLIFSNMKCLYTLSTVSINIRSRDFFSWHLKNREIKGVAILLASHSHLSSSWADTVEESLNTYLIKLLVLPQMRAYDIGKSKMKCVLQLNLA